MRYFQELHCTKDWEQGVLGILLGTLYTNNRGNVSTHFTHSLPEPEHLNALFKLLTLTFSYETSPSYDTTDLFSEILQILFWNFDLGRLFL